MIRSNVLLAGFILFAGAHCGSAHPSTTSRKASDTPQAAEIRQRVNTTFVLADYYKPAEQTPEQQARLAPLIAQQVASYDVFTPWICGIRRVNGAWHYDWVRPAIYLREENANLRAGAVRQLSYLWCDGKSPWPDSFKARWLGIRMTLDTRGNPVIWEAFAEGDPTVKIFVARSLEEKAAKQFGAVLSGRQFAIERSTQQQPAVVVARVLEDGPEPMGPFVYVSSEDEITTVTCRCMPSQFSNVRKTHEYRLEPLASVAGVKPRNGGLSFKLDRPVPTSVCDLVPNLPDCSRPDWLDVALRLPPDF